jgi:hypothetical protein
MSPVGDSALEILDALGLRDKHVTKFQMSMEPGEIVTVDLEVEVQESPSGEWRRRLERYKLVPREETVDVDGELVQLGQLTQDAARWREVLRNPFTAVDAIMRSVNSHDPSAMWKGQANAAIDALLKKPTT